MFSGGKIWSVYFQYLCHSNHTYILSVQSILHWTGISEFIRFRWKLGFLCLLEVDVFLQQALSFWVNLRWRWYTIFCFSLLFLFMYLQPHIFPERPFQIFVQFLLLIPLHLLYKSVLQLFLKTLQYSNLEKG